VHHLHELIHPWHLIEETDALHHCLGKPHNSRWPGQDDDLFTFPYWKIVAFRRARLFSLGGPTGPLCTLHVHVKPPRLVQVQGRAREDILLQPYTPALVDAVAFLRGQFPGLDLDAYPSLAVTQAALPLIAQALRWHRRRS
jgi:hypothetical protein